MTAAITTALNNHPSIGGSANVLVTLDNSSARANPFGPADGTNPIDGFRWKIAFRGALLDTDIPTIAANLSALPGATAVVDDGKTLDINNAQVNGLGFQGRISAPPRSA